MTSDKYKMLVLVGWVVTVGLAAFALQVTSATNWAVVACLAAVPPVIVRHFWQAPEQTMSQSIQNARR